jgi:hypothetical protein
MADMRRQNDRNGGDPWEITILKVTRYAHVSRELKKLIREQHERRGHGSRPTIHTVSIVLQACESEGIFGLGA